MTRATPYIIGLTGGIGSGKSTVADQFRSLGIPVIDADEIARSVVAPGSACLDAIRDHFGSGLIDPNGGLDRAAMRQRIFSDPEAKSWLENLLHPVIRSGIHARIQESQGPYVLLVVPLLLESGQYDFVDRILVVDVPEDVQMARTVARDDCPADQVRQIMATQVTRRERLQQADDVLDNDIPPEQLPARVRTLHDQYLAAAKASANH